MNKSDVDEAVGYVNKIIDNVRCATCDRLEGKRVRYPCGHSACNDCVAYTEECQFCTPPSQESDSRVKPDYPLTSTVKNATNLLKACQNLFHVNAFQHKRISEQLKIEKELFPKCIQAPLKYGNKRKSTSFYSKNKENLNSTYFPGEAISTPKENKMDNSVSYVQQWLNKNEQNLARKPFTDINVNMQWTNSPKSKTSQINNGDRSPKIANRKRSHFKTTDKEYSRLGGNMKLVYHYDSPTKVKKKKKSNAICTVKKNSTKVVQSNCDNDESGIFMDPIVIDDSQQSVIDKDKKAWLAVLEACENDNSPSNSIVNFTQVNITNNSNKPLANHNDVEMGIYKVPEIGIYKVPFVKKSAIMETCRYCKNEINSYRHVPVTSPSKPVKITIDSDHFLTTITVFKNVQNNLDKNTSHVSIQTDETCSIKFKPAEPYCDVKNNIKETDVVDEEAISEKHSEDIFLDDRQIFGDVLNVHKKEINKCVVIEESDSDSNLEVSGPISVKADVHRSYHELEYGTLTEIVNVKHHESKPRRGPRGHTPTSTDSSEKENYNPNRMRRDLARKKKSAKK